MCVCVCVCVPFCVFLCMCVFFNPCRFGFVCICVYVFECAGLNIVCLGDSVLVFVCVLACVFARVPVYLFARRFTVCV